MASSTEAVSAPAIADHPVRAALLLGALGVVFGDIGTSPIYAFRESLKGARVGGSSVRRTLPRLLGHHFGRRSQIRRLRHEGGQ